MNKGFFEAVNACEGRSDELWQDCGEAPRRLQGRDRDLADHLRGLGQEPLEERSQAAILSSDKFGVSIDASSWTASPIDPMTRRVQSAGPTFDVTYHSVKASKEGGPLDTLILEVRSDDESRLVDVPLDEQAMAYLETPAGRAELLKPPPRFDPTQIEALNTRLASLRDADGTAAPRYRVEALPNINLWCVFWVAGGSALIAAANCSWAALGFWLFVACVAAYVGGSTALTIAIRCLR